MGPKPFRYMRADVMPLFAAVAVGIGAAGTIITRKLFAVGIPVVLSRTLLRRLALRQHQLDEGRVAAIEDADRALFRTKENKEPSYAREAD